LLYCKTDAPPRYYSTVITELYIYIERERERERERFRGNDVKELESEREIQRRGC